MTVTLQKCLPPTAAQTQISSQWHFCTQTNTVCSVYSTEALVEEQASTYFSVSAERFDASLEKASLLMQPGAVINYVCTKNKQTCDFYTTSNQF